MKSRPRAVKPARAKGTPARADAVVHKSQRLKLDADISINDAFAKVAIACRDHWDANHAAAVSGTSAEGIHQFRVGLRRFRTALTLFRAYLPEAQYTWMKTEAKTLADVVSEARDLDVFLTDLVPKSRAARTKQLAEAARAARADAQTRIEALLTGARYRRFLARLNMWLDGKAWDPEGTAPAQEFARVELNRRLGKIQKRAKAIDRAKPAELHELRIAIKKLRYGLEFFESLLPARRAERIGRLLKSLQDSLGRLNDLDVAERTLATLTAKAEQGDAKSPKAPAKLTHSFKPLAKATLPDAARVAARLREQKPL